jgi:hypothetical protein
VGEDHRVTTGPESLKITSYPPSVYVAKREDLASEGRVRRWILTLGGALGAGLVLLHAAQTDQWGTHLSAAGIILVIAGATLLTTGLMWPAWASKEMARPRSGESKSATTYWEQTAIDARIAFALLLAGFVLQGLAIVLASR